MKVFIAGGTGFVGSYLVDRFLRRGFEVAAAGRRPYYPGGQRAGLSYISADTTRAGPWQAEAASAQVVVNLAGRTIFHYWTDRYKQKIYSSRILTTANLVEALAAENARPRLLLNASAVGYYGDTGDEVVDESRPAGDDFLARVAADWEKEALAAADFGVRVVTMRFGVILGAGGGALAGMIPLFRLFVGGPLGSGRQWMSWMHIEDLARAIDFIMDRREVEGPLNFCSPNPVAQRNFARALGRALGRPAVLPAPAFAVKALMGDLGRTLLAGQRAHPRKLLENGFQFRYPDIDQALAGIVSRR